MARLAKQRLCKCITLFLYISLPSLHEYDVKRFVAGRQHKETNFFLFFWTCIRRFRIQPQKNPLTFQTNWTWWNKRVEVWNSANLIYPASDVFAAVAVAFPLLGTVEERTLGTRLGSALIPDSCAKRQAFPFLTRPSLPLLHFWAVLPRTSFVLTPRLA